MRKEYWITEGEYEGDGFSFPYDAFYSTVTDEPYEHGIHVINKAVVDKLIEALEWIVNDSRSHGCECIDKAEQALKEYKGSIKEYKGCK